MASIEQEVAVIEKFRTSWRSIGWWSEVSRVGGYWFKAVLLPPRVLQEMLNNEHEESLEIWKKNSVYVANEITPERLEYPTSYNKVEIKWSVGTSALTACGGAIDIAKRDFPDEMPTVEQFRFAVQTSSAS